MEKKVKRLGALKWMSFLLGFIMYSFTINSFGYLISSLCTIIATVSFWNIVRNEQTRIIGRTIADEIKKAISETGNVDNLIEIKRSKSGIIARVYLINAKERAQLIHRAIASHMDSCSFKRYIWVMQLTDMPGRSSFSETQKILNEQLVDELTKKRKQEKEEKRK